jgi:hypothetical protein
LAADFVDPEGVLAGQEVPLSHEQRGEDRTPGPGPLFQADDGLRSMYRFDGSFEVHPGIG